MKAAPAVSTCRANEGMAQSFEAFKLLALSVERWALDVGRCLSSSCLTGFGHLPVSAKVAD